MKKLEDVLIDVWDEKVPVKLFLTQMKKNYIFVVWLYDRVLQKLAIGKIRKKTKEKLFEEMKELQEEMIEIGAVFRSAMEYAKKEWVADLLLEDKFLNDSWQLTPEQKEELAKEEQEYKDTQSRYDKYMEHFTFLAKPATDIVLVPTEDVA